MLDCKTILLIVGVILIFNVMNLYNSSKSNRKAKRITKLELIKKKLNENFAEDKCANKCMRKAYKHPDCHKIIDLANEEKRELTKDEHKKYKKCVSKKGTNCVKVNCN